jgi:hypothetical protein
MSKHDSLQSQSPSETEEVSNPLLEEAAFRFLVKNLSTMSREELVANLAHALGENAVLKDALNDAKQTRAWAWTRLDKLMK